MTYETKYGKFNLVYFNLNNTMNNIYFVFNAFDVSL